MNLGRFMQLVRGGEKSNVDFKLTWNAFNRNTGDQEKAKAELVKDVCAMANNGVSTSYLIIGVGDDFESDDVLFGHIDQARRAMTEEIQRWLRKSPNALAKAFPSYAEEDASSFREHATSIRELVGVPRTSKKARPKP